MCVLLTAVNDSFRATVKLSEGREGKVYIFLLQHSALFMQNQPFCWSRVQICSMHRHTHMHLNSFFFLNMYVCVCVICSAGSPGCETAGLPLKHH